MTTASRSVAAGNVPDSSTLRAMPASSSAIDRDLSGLLDVGCLSPSTRNYLPCTATNAFLVLAGQSLRVLRDKRRNP